ncbi:ShlB/FhaC/HecB family hemolysin secretion/activation protein [Vibrio gazogenes]|uniref:Hemolysin activation/secretion protein n=1 Tax=Vibrio gazogenes DSM 21264 = NBRC 103151 TaxID=1123492 RepID=A0A1M4UM52_VIBGA|nr:ShlB/FhaC/HecB family hemolysin secretion/activation protein [Vibrio gazogenes]USP15735.1 ShlB/FhaC/HecB family hemolysin secretion/activation protein [Vibrio gazogenes]SHE57738.1 Hemolysin activation/secretion protein [Vibrio gazogenes DSM 21264] [Vibrio gazogenes DSM 21264 = NBRC 103151]SJN52695.1 Hemolysin transporter protein ShlB precursor [Vibrio gazogenes]
MRRRYFQRLALSKYLFLAGCSYFISFYAYSHNGMAPISPATQASIEQEQRQRLQEIEQAKQSVQQLSELPTLPPSETTRTQQCFPIQQIVFSGNTLFSHQQILAWIDFKPGCLGLPQINEYLRTITNQYISAGYVTSRAYLVPQDLTSGELKIVILEGKLEALKFNGRTEGFLNNAFPGLIDHIFNLREIEQGLDQINRLSRYNAQIKIRPGSKQGYSIVDIRSETRFWGNTSFGVENSGQKSTGETQFRYALNAENIIDALDQWSLSGSRSLDPPTGHASESLSLSLDIPYGRWNANYRTAYSSYESGFVSNDFVFGTSGKTNSHDVTLKRLITRDAQSKSFVTMGLNHRREKNYLMDSLIVSSSRNLSSAYVGLDYSTRLGSGFLTVSPRLTMGSDLFGGERNQPGFPKAQFRKGTLTASYTQPFQSGPVFTSTLFAQWSNDTLYSSQRLSIGGEYSVRGFKDVSISGDEGYYWRNDLSYPLGTLPYIGQVSALWAVDTGSIVRDKNDALERGSLMGSSLGIQTRSRRVSSSLAIGMPLDAPGALDADHYIVNYRLNIAI